MQQHSAFTRSQKPDRFPDEERFIGSQHWGEGDISPMHHETVNGSNENGDTDDR